MGGTAAIAMMGIGAGVSATGQYSAGTKQKEIAFWNAASIDEVTEINASLIEEGTAANAAILEFNAFAAEAAARDALQRGLEAEGLQRKAARQLIGSQRAAYAAQGVEVNADTALDVQADTAYLAELDALTLRLNAVREAWGYQVEAENVRMQAGAVRKVGAIEARGARKAGRASAQSARMGGNLALSAGKFGAAGTIVGTAGTVLAQKFGFT